MIWDMLTLSLYTHCKNSKRLFLSSNLQKWFGIQNIAKQKYFLRSKNFVKVIKHFILYLKCRWNTTILPYFLPWRACIPRLLSWKADKLGSCFGGAAKTEVPCHSSCGTIKFPPFVALHDIGEGRETTRAQLT